MSEKPISTTEAIAQALGVSKTTVSRAISGKGRISPETRQRVRDYAAEHGYSPNSGTPVQQRCALGLVLPAQQLTGRSVQQCLLGVCQTANANGWDVVLLPVTGHDTDALQRDIAQRRIDGLLLLGTALNDDLTPLAKTSGLPTVVLGASPDTKLLHVDGGTREGCHALTSALIGQGLHRLALLGRDELSHMEQSRRLGFQDAFYEANRVVIDELTFPNLDNPAKVEQALDTALRLHADCIICTEDTLCAQVLGLLYRRKLRIPEDMRIACCSLSPLLDSSPAEVTGLRFDGAALGRSACTLLLQHINGTAVQSSQTACWQLALCASTRQTKRRQSETAAQFPTQQTLPLP